jgi:hypothetical protein
MKATFLRMGWQPAAAETPAMRKLHEKIVNAACLLCAAAYLIAVR